METFSVEKKSKEFLEVMLVVSVEEEYRYSTRANHYHTHNGNRLRLSLAGLEVALGFASITLYMGSTIFYPLLQLNEFTTKALHNGMLDVLMSRYIGYLPLVIFGSISVIAGNWFWYTKKETSNIVIVTISALFFITFTVLIAKNFV